MGPKIKLTYFDVPGRAQPIRHTFAIGGVAFDDEHVTWDQFDDMKKAGAVPFNSLPALTVDGETFVESGAVLRFAGKLAGLYPAVEKDAMKVDMICDTLETLVSSILRDKTEAARAKVVAELFPLYYGTIDQMYSAVKGPFLLGETLTIADVKLANFALPMNTGGFLNHVPAGCVDKFPHVLACAKAVMGLDRVKEWHATRQIAPPPIPAALAAAKTADVPQAVGVPGGDAAPIGGMQGMGVGADDTKSDASFAIHMEESAGPTMGMQENNVGYANEMPGSNYAPAPPAMQSNYAPAPHMQNEYAPAIELPVAPGMEAPNAAGHPIDVKTNATYAPAPPANAEYAPLAANNAAYAPAPIDSAYAPAPPNNAGYAPAAVSQPAYAPAPVAQHNAAYPPMAQNTAGLAIAMEGNAAHAVEAQGQYAPAIEMQTSAAPGMGNVPGMEMQGRSAEAMQMQNSVAQAFELQNEAAPGMGAVPTMGIPNQPQMPSAAMPEKNTSTFV